MENKKQTKHRKKHRYKKVVLQIAMVCALLCSVVRWMPTKTFADTTDATQKTCHYKYVTTGVDGAGNEMIITYDLQGTSPIYLVEHRSTETWLLTSYYFVSLESWEGSIQLSEANSKWSTTISLSPSTARCNKYGSFYYCSVNEDQIYGNPPRWVLNAIQYNNDSDAGKTDACNSESYNMHFNAKFIYAKNKYDLGDMIWETGEGVEGTKDNPIEDEDIGTIRIAGKSLNQDPSATISPSDNDFSNIEKQLYTIWKWKNTTSTGFSLNKNKYARTFIQVKVESRCLVYKNLKHTEIKEKWNSYGETASLYTELPVDQNPKIIYLSDILSVLPNTKAENHSILYSGMNFRYYWRIVCTDDLAVIPSDTAKWYCGGWRALDLNMDSNTSKEVNDVSNGHFDEDGKWVDDEDDGYNDETVDNSGEYTQDEARDNVDKKPGSISDEIGWSDFENLINQCKKVPDLIKSVFSFLPDWLFKFVTLGLFIWIFVLIKRAVA